MVCLRKNTVSLNLSGIPRNLNAFEIHKLIQDKFGFPKESVRNIEIIHAKVFIGFNSGSIPSDLVEKFGSSIQYKDVSDILYQIPLIHEDREIKVKVHNIPFDVDNAIIVEALSKYGEVLSITNDLWENYFPYQVYNGLRSVSMVLFLPIPSYVNIFENKTLITYEGQKKTCKFCESVDHNLEDCPLDVEYLYRCNKKYSDQTSNTKVSKENTTPELIQKGKDYLTTDNVDGSNNHKTYSNIFTFGGISSAPELKLKNTLQSSNLNNNSIFRIPTSNNEVSPQSNSSNIITNPASLFNFRTLPPQQTSITNTISTSSAKSFNSTIFTPSTIEDLLTVESTSEVLNNAKTFSLRRLGEKLVTDLPGVYGNAASNLTNIGYSKAYHVLGQFLHLKKSKEEFTKWLKTIPEIELAQIEECYNYLSCYCKHFV